MLLTILVIICLWVVYKNYVNKHAKIIKDVSSRVCNSFSDGLIDKLKNEGRYDDRVKELERKLGK